MRHINTERGSGYENSYRSSKQGGADCDSGYKNSRGKRIDALRNDDDPGTDRKQDQIFITGGRIALYNEKTPDKTGGNL